MTDTPEAPEAIKGAASRIASVALGPFIMGEKHVDLDALEQRIIKAVEREMIAVVSGILVVLYDHTDVLNDVHDLTRQLEVAAKNIKVQKTRARTIRSVK
jgi:hypothetical protein